MVSYTKEINKEKICLPFQFRAQKILRKGILWIGIGRKKSSLLYHRLKKYKVGSQMMVLICWRFNDYLSSTHTAYQKKRRKATLQRRWSNTNPWKIKTQRLWKKPWIRCQKTWSKTSSAGITWVANSSPQKKNRIFQRGLMCVQVAMFKSSSQKTCNNQVISLLSHLTGK